MGMTSIRVTIFIMNDSYLQGTHLHDITAIGRSFTMANWWGLARARAHWGDIGAIDPGSTLSSTDIYQEGLRLGPTRIMSRGKAIREWYMDHLRPEHPPEGRHHRRPWRPDRRDPDGERRLGSF